MSLLQNYLVKTWVICLWKQKLGADAWFLLLLKLQLNIGPKTLTVQCVHGSVRYICITNADLTNIYSC